MTKTRRVGFSRKRRRGGRKTVKRRGGRRRSRVKRRGGKRRSRISRKSRGGRRSRRGGVFQCTGDPADCNNRGDCPNGVCICQQPWTGERCKTQDTGGGVIS